MLTSKVLKKRFEEISQQVNRFEKELKETGDAGSDPIGSKPNGILRNQGLRTLESYSGEHKKYNKWRSKLKGILCGENEAFRMALKVMEAPERLEIAPVTEGAAEYENQIEKIADAMGVDAKTVVYLSQQLQCLLTAYCEDTALSIVDSLENHGKLAGLEAWRRLYAEQRGTLSQRTDSLREMVIYPEKVQQLTEVMGAITGWEKAYTELVDMCGGCFKLDEKGKIGALKRLLPQEIVTGMVLISSSLKSYKDARAFALEELPNSCTTKEGPRENHRQTALLTMMTTMTVRINGVPMAANKARNGPRNQSMQ